MATDKLAAPNIDNSDPANFPNGRIRDNDGSGNGTGVNRLIYSDLHEFFAKLMRLAAIAYNGQPESEANGYQLITALMAFAGKNDYITPLTSNGTDVSIPMDLSILNNNEALVCLVNFDYAAEADIKGNVGTSTLALTVPKPFKNGEYVRFVKTGSGVTLIRLVDDINLDVVVGELLYLKSATLAEEYAGAITNKATNPYNNQLTFFRRVCGLDSSMYLATSSRNGLLSMTDKAIIDAIGANPIRNIGWFSGVDPGGGIVGSFASKSGDILTAQISSLEANSTTYLITLNHAMAGTNYFVRSTVQSEGTMNVDNDVLSPVFRPISSTQFYWVISENIGTSGTQSLKIHIEVVQIS